MGKAQSKRSIDITTDPKKVGEGDEVAGKVEKIDVDQKTDAPAVNGDAATPKEGGDEAAAVEKKETEEHSENDKDLTTEKNAAAAEGGDAAAETAKGEEGSPKEAAAGEDITPLADESIKSKSKKDKVKKKWSFRSISFGKKDKQKPAKSEEATSPTSGTTSPTTAEAEAAPSADAASAEPSVATNGEAEKPAESATATSEPASKDEKPAENGSATEQEKQANGEAEKAAPAPSIVEEAAKPKPAEEPATVTATESNTTATEEVPVKESQPEPEVVTNGHGAGEALTNGSSNGLAESPVTETAPIADNIPSNVDDEQPHQNGTNGTTTPPPTPVATEIEKGQQIEASSEVIETVTPSQAEEEVVAAIIKAVSSELEAETETETEAEGFVVVASVSTEVEVPVSISPVKPVAEVSQVETEPVVEIPEVEAKSVAETESVPEVSEVQTEQVAEVAEVESESVIVETRSSSPPPPLPKSPPPSRVSAFVLSEDVIEEQVTPNVPEVNEIKSDEIEQQAISMVAEITEQAAEIVTEKEKQEEEPKVDSVPEPVEESTSTVEVEESTSTVAVEEPTSTVEVEESTSKVEVEESTSTVEVEEVLPVPSPTADEVQKTFDDQATPDEEESFPVPASIDPADGNDYVAVTESVDFEVQKETVSISSNGVEPSAVSDDEAAIENKDEILQEQPSAVEETTEQEQQVISEETHSDNDKENEIDLVENIISDLDAPITKTGGDLLVELDVRPTEQEGESNNKVDLAKDLKEKNAAAADVTTQEQLPVTCE
ncbi:A-kinase anchor protein 200 isoform X1 [Drosophila santomea]|uniref:A-kinase anchor protein 200 isoform X1 n=1 Tax=Drosophila santomea TaxID=129105 RepID=UPI00195371A3|nr:A-kinase anchor protein 200 isoform X1 [Drosophila santomea]XP_039495084.1 A-kinase anchor protein 200 isoform X1 [Drosophila santomea]